jgi:hypothetical protein
VAHSSGAQFIGLDTTVMFGKSDSMHSVKPCERSCPFWVARSP